MKKYTLSLLVGCLCLQLSAQQTPLSNFYNFNEYLINPAQAGHKNQLEGSISQRLQWQGIEGSPTTSFLGIHGALNSKMGLGAKFMVDQTDILQQFSGSLSYAYRVWLNDKARLNFGISAMALQNSINYSQAIVGDYADEALSGGDQDGFTFDAEIGTVLEYSKLKIGVASSHLFESGVKYELPDKRGSATFDRVRQITAFSSFRFELKEQWEIEPFVVLRNQGLASFQYEVNALIAYQRNLFLGFAYRQEAAYIGKVGFQISDHFLAAYAFEFSNSGVASYSSGSHEFMLAYKLNKAKF